jgi:hypothetical protein
MTSVSSIMASNNRGLNNKNNKQLQEVKEVIQNKSDADINKILEVFNNDVSKTINAFMSGKIFFHLELSFFYIVAKWEGSQNALQKNACEHFSNFEKKT